MKEKILIVEDQFVEADYLRLMLTKAGYKVTGIAHSVAQAEGLIKQEKPDIVLLDIFVKGKLTGIDLASQLGEENIAFVYLSANSDEEVLNAAKATQPYGFLVKPFREKDLLITLEIARYRHAHSVESNLRKETILNDKLSAIVAGPEHWKKKMLDICRTLQSHIPFDYVTAGFNTLADPESPALSFLRIGFDEYQQIGIAELLTIANLDLKKLKILADNTYHEAIPLLLIGRASEQTWRSASLDKLVAEKFGVRSSISLPIFLSNGGAFIICFYSRKQDAYSADYLELLSRLQKPLTVDIESIFYPGKVNAVTIARDSPAASGRFDDTYGFDGIVGRSPLLLNVFDLTTQVAPSDTSVLLLGESGTGKERFADSIHNRVRIIWSRKRFVYRST